MKSILLTFEDEIQRDKFLQLLRDVTSTMVSAENADISGNGQFITNTLNNLRLDPPIKTDSERQVALFVAGKKMVEGNLIELNKRFTQEITQHSGSVQIREMRDGKWVVIRQRGRGNGVVRER